MEHIEPEPEQEDDKLYKRLEIELRSHDKAVMKSYVKFATTAANHLNIDVGKWYVIAMSIRLFILQ